MWLALRTGFDSCPDAKGCCKVFRRQDIKPTTAAQNACKAECNSTSKRQISRRRQSRVCGQHPICRPYEMNDKMEAFFIRSQDYDSYHATAAMFHAALVVAAGNQLLIETYNRIKVRFRRYQAALSKIPELPPQSVAEHKGILDAMEPAILN
jgi:DNA-binding FadR family transcriptional regulator